MLNLVTTDMAASLDFYRRLGIAVPEGQDAAGGHVQLRMPGGFSLELDTAESARLWHAGWRADPAGVRVVIGFSLPTREAVDRRYAELTSAGHAGRQPPFDAFWGARVCNRRRSRRQRRRADEPHRRITPRPAARAVTRSLSDAAVNPRHRDRARRTASDEPRYPRRAEYPIRTAGRVARHRAGEHV